MFSGKTWAFSRRNPETFFAWETLLTEIPQLANFIERSSLVKSEAV